MIEVKGICLPDGETHMVDMIDNGPLVDGKGTYQLKKYHAALAHVAKPRGVAIDVGAHVGLWARVMLRDFEAVVAFEPVPELFACLRLNAGRAGGRANLVPAAVGAYSGEATIEMAADNTGHTQLRQPHEKPGKHRVLVTTLDKAFPADFDMVVSLIKIDVEGMEYDVLRGGADLIRSHRPVVVIEQKAGNAEHFGHAQFAAKELLQSWGAEEKGVLSGDHIFAFPPL